MGLHIDDADVSFNLLLSELVHCRADVPASPHSCGGL